MFISLIKTLTMLSIAADTPVGLFNRELKILKGWT